jgi:hypothetical protein
VVCGPGGIPDQVIDVKASTIIQGETYAATKALMFPDVQVPPKLTYMGSLTASATIAGGRFRYDVIDLPNSGILRITGPTVLYVTGKMTLGKSAEVIVESGGSLELYLGTSLEDKNSVGFSNLNGNDPRALKIYGMPTCTWIDLKAKSTMAAAVYAPNADLNLYNSGDFYGSMTSYSFEMKNSGNFHFDARLKDVNIDDPAAVFVVGRWWEN